jgi:tRNA threonylcarbamoyladenosine biosynthesis protein TsaB
MLAIALDTTTRAGSIALARDGGPIETFAGDGARTHAARLPGDILDLLARHGASLADVDLFAVAAGPGSFTGLRIGIATIQGLAFANRRPVVGVSALEALAFAGAAAARSEEERSHGRLVGAWMDAQRGEVYAELYRLGDGLELLAPAIVAAPATVLDGWGARIDEDEGRRLVLVGDGALAYRSIVEARLRRASIHAIVPPLAPAIAHLALGAASRGLAGAPHAIRPIYVRRPDAELARDRKRAAEAGLAEPGAKGGAHG